MSIGVGLKLNTKVKFEVPGVSVGAKVNYYNFDRRFLVGLAYFTNAKRNKTTFLAEKDPEVIAAESVFSQLAYNHAVYGLTAGWMLTEQWYLVGGFDVETLERFYQFKAQEQSTLPATFYRAAGEQSTLFSFKYGVQYKRGYFIYGVFYSQRGIALGVNYLFNG